MLKLKILNKPKILKLKCTSKFPDVVLANFQEKGVTPTEEIQVVVADKPYDGLSKVTIQPIPSEYIVPTGFREITENGSYDVSEYQVADVFVPEKILGTKTIKQNGVYNATEDNLDGYSSVDIKVEGWDTSQIRSCQEMFRDNDDMVDAPYFNTENVINMSFMLYSCDKLEKIPGYDTSKVTNFTSYIGSSLKVKEFPNLDFSEAKQITGLCQYCIGLEKIPLLYAGKVTMAGEYVLGGCKNLLDVGGFKDLGKAYTAKTVNYSYYSFSVKDCTKLTHDSLMNIINNLYDLNLTYNVANGGTLSTQKLMLGSTNLAKLTADEIAIATNKGWTVS